MLSPSESFKCYLNFHFQRLVSWVHYLLISMAPADEPLSKLQPCINTLFFLEVAGQDREYNVVDIIHKCILHSTMLGSTHIPSSSSFRPAHFIWQNEKKNLGTLCRDTRSPGNKEIRKCWRAPSKALSYLVHEPVPPSPVYWIYSHDSRSHSFRHWFSFLFLN